jgi:prevent-host-death family protein
MTRDYGIEEARKRLGDLVTAVQQGADVVITRNGKPAVRLVRLQEDTMLTITDLAIELGMTRAPERVARYAGAFTEHDPRTGQLPKPWNGKGMDATFTRDQADQIIADWHRDAAHAEGMEFLLPDDPEAAEVVSRYRDQP